MDVEELWNGCGKFGMGMEWLWNGVGMEWMWKKECYVLVVVCSQPVGLGNVSLVSVFAGIDVCPDMWVHGQED